MKRKTLSLLSVNDEQALSRNEMKHIMAGSGENDCINSPKCLHGCAEKDGNRYYCSTCCLASANVLELT